MLNMFRHLLWNFFIPTFQNLQLFIYFGYFRSFPKKNWLLIWFRLVSSCFFVLFLCFCFLFIYLFIYLFILFLIFFCRPLLIHSIIPEIINCTNLWVIFFFFSFAFSHFKRWKYCLFYYVFTGPLAYWVECSPTVQETGFQSQVDSYQRLKNDTWYLLAEHSL